MLPDSVPLSRLRHFLESALDSQLTLKRRTQVLKGLLYAENLQVRSCDLVYLATVLNFIKLTLFFFIFFLYEKMFRVAMHFKCLNKYLIIKSK